jgi:hypothetical protein
MLTQTSPQPVRMRFEGLSHSATLLLEECVERHTVVLIASRCA